MPQLDYIGTSPTKSDAVVKAVGDTIYGDDFRLPGELYGKVVRAEITPARIKKIDVKKALSIPGVHCVLTAKDIPGQNAGRYPDFPLLANEIVLDIGDPIALIAAENRDLAEEAAKSIKITYDKLSGSYDFRDLKKHGYNLINELNKLRNEGLVNELGVSVYSPKEALFCLNFKPEYSLLQK